MQLGVVKDSQGYLKIRIVKKEQREILVVWLTGMRRMYIYICASLKIKCMKQIAIIASVVISLFSTHLYAQDKTNARIKEFNLTGDNVAIKGYDPVAYFKSNAAIKGSKSLAVYAQGITYYFSSVENKEEFRKNAAKYEPAYGGWCAYAMGAKGDKVNIDPNTFKILNGKLYLFYNRGSNNTLLTWNKDEPSLRNKADNNWKTIFP
jgi:YHS domain-containing protein